MERVLQQMQIDLENLSYNYDKLAAHLKLAINEHHLMESMLAELEEEHDKAINKIEFLEQKVRFCFIYKHNFRPSVPFHIYRLST